MQLLRLNSTKFEYLPYAGGETDLDENGRHTGEFHPKYGDPVPYRGNISSPSGSAAHEWYGLDIRYTHVLVMSNPNTPIDETGLIRWKGDLYEVTAVRPTLNAFKAALRKRTKNHAEVT